MQSPQPTNLDAEHEASFCALSSVHSGFCTLLARAMSRHCGRDWFQVVCPRPVFDRMIERKEREQAIDRSADEYQELMTFANFRDMADIIAGSGGVSKLFRKLVATEDDLLEVLDHLERCRRYLGFGHRLSPADERLVRAAHEGFERFTQHAKTQNAAGDEEPSVPPWSAIESPTGRDVPTAPPPPEATAIDSEAAAGSEVEPDADQGEGTPTAAVTPDSAMLPAKVAEAIRADDLHQVMAALRAEVVDLADELLGGAVGKVPVVWRGLRDDDWHARHHELQGLQRLTDFYALFECYQKRRADGLGASELAALVAEHELPKLLMELREIFNAVATA